MSKANPKYRRATHELGRSVGTYNRGRGALGAALGAFVPYAFGAAQHGLLLGGSLGVIALFGALMIVCGMLGSTILGGIHEVKRAFPGSASEEYEMELLEKERHRSQETGIFSSIDRDH